jgi:hypothetical protein
MLDTVADLVQSREQLLLSVADADTDPAVAAEMLAAADGLASTTALLLGYLKSQSEDPDNMREQQIIAEDEARAANGAHANLVPCARVQLTTSGRIFPRGAALDAALVAKLPASCVDWRTEATAKSREAPPPVPEAVRPTVEIIAHTDPVQSYILTKARLVELGMSPASAEDAILALPNDVGGSLFRRALVAGAARTPNPTPGHVRRIPPRI